MSVLHPCLGTSLIDRKGNVMGSWQCVEPTDLCRCFFRALDERKRLRKPAELAWLPLPVLQVLRGDGRALTLEGPATSGKVYVPRVAEAAVG